MPAARPSPAAGTASLGVDDVKAETERLREAGAKFRSDLIIGIGGDQVLLEDPSGNPVELFQQKSG